MAINLVLQVIKGGLRLEKWTQTMRSDEFLVTKKGYYLGHFVNVGSI